jgi:hypothetical protein
MAVLAHLDPAQRALDRRSSRRRALSLTIDGKSDASGMPAVVHDLSQTGLLLETRAELAVGDNIEVVLPHIGAARASVVWSSGPFLGCAFETPITRGAVSASLLKSDPAIATRDQSLSSDPAPIYVDDTPNEDGYRARLNFFIIVGSSIAAWALIALVFMAL